MSLSTTKPSRRNVLAAQVFAANVSVEATLDAQDVTTFYARELEWIDNELREIKYAPLQSEELIPYDKCGGPGFVTVTWRCVMELGEAEFISDGMTKLPRVDVAGSELSRTVRNLGDSWAITIFDIKRLLSNPTIRMDARKKEAAYNAIRRLHEKTAMVGRVDFGWTGLVNDANIPLTTQAGSGTGWATATADEIVADINKLTWSVVTNSKGLYVPETLLIPLSLGPRLDLPMGDDKNKTVRKYILDNSQHIKEIRTTYHLDTANAAGTGPRVLAYNINKDVLRYGANEMFTEDVPQREGTEIVTNCYGMSSGTQVLLPLSCAYMDVD